MPRYQRPGVYVQEVTTSVPTITPTPISRTLFLGSAPRGPVGRPLTIHGVSDFHANFGNGAERTALERAVELFFANDGMELTIVRMFRSDPLSSVPSKAVIDLGAFTLEAASEGLWGRRIVASVDLQREPGLHDKLKDREGGPFNLILSVFGAGHTAPEEIHRDLTLGDGPRRVDRVLEAGSKIVRFLSRSKEVTTVSEGRFVAVGGSDGLPLNASSITGSNGGGMNAVDRTDGFDILYIPPYNEGQDVEPNVLVAAGERCRANKAILLLDAPRGWSSIEDATKGIEEIRAAMGDTAKDTALYFPNLIFSGGTDRPLYVPPAGAVAGAIVRNDRQRGLWKVPAGVEAVIKGAADTALKLTDGEISALNSLAINCLRKLPDGRVVIWGGRTLDGSDPRSSEWKYLPVRRLSLFIEKSLQKGLEWAVFEANDQILWSKVRYSVEAFLLGLFHQGAFQGTTPNDAFFVRCGNDTTAVDELKQGLLNLQVGVAALRPAEFIILRMQLRVGI
jgi:uncharacterized protein